MTAWFGTTRVRLAIAYSGIFSVVALVAAGALSLAIARIEYAAIDDSLASEARSVQATLVAGGTLPGSNSARDASAQGRGVGIAAVVFDSHTGVLDTSGQGPAAGALAPTARRAASSGSTILETQSMDRVMQRIRANPILLKSGETRVLVLTRSTAEADQVASTTATVLLLGMLVLIIAATVLGYGLAGTALRPVREIVATARAFSEQDLHRRITLDLPSDELGELADTFNGMLARLETAFDSLRRFTADAAHELRAPLTLIRTEAEVTLRRPRSAEEYQASLATVLAEAQRLARMADQLLILARAEAGALAPQMTRVEMDTLVDDAVRLWQPLAAEREVTVVNSAGGGGTVWGDADLLRRLLDNLIDNAVRYSPPGSHIGVTSRPVDRDWELAVKDSGPGVPKGAQATIFERFSRA
ncbi:MAG TPA: ATP-binding protein, partial [Candidatus Dormibacteraeota bacterium]|nr:ATP-binding protein [Candidatus Dormibacteraeota bacterium]